MTIAPLASSLSQPAITLNNRGFTAAGVWFRKRKMMTLGASARHGENVSEIQIEGEHDPLLSGSFGDDIGIGKPNQTFVAEMHRVVIGGTQGLHGRD